MRVLLVDGHGILRAGVQALLMTNKNTTVVGAAGSGEEALRLAAKNSPDVVLLGMNLKDTSPVRLIQRLLESEPGTRILVLAAPADRRLVTEALEAGASGYVLKRATASELMDALQATRRGELYLDPAITRSVFNDEINWEEDGRDQPLTRRELDVLQLVVKGYTNREVAAQLGISPRTVESHRANLMARLGVRSRVELVSYAQQHGLLDADRVAGARM